MTAILGYTKRIGSNSIGVLCADDLEGHSKTKVDKLTKLAGRFVVAVAGLEIVDWVPSTIPLNCINDLQNVLSSVLKYALKRWRETNTYDGIDQQLDNRSIIVVLDTATNKLYFADLGKVWRSSEDADYRIELSPLEDGLYSFGVVAKGNYDIVEGLNIIDRTGAMKFIDGMMKMYQSNHSGSVGCMGAVQVSVIGENEFNHYKSCFHSYIDFVENVVSRRLYEKNS